MTVKTFIYIYSWNASLRSLIVHGQSLCLSQLVLTVWIYILTLIEA